MCLVMHMPFHLQLRHIVIFLACFGIWRFSVSQADHPVALSLQPLPSRLAGMTMAVLATLYIISDACGPRL